MSVYPYSRLFIGSSKTIAISGPHIQIVDTSTGDVLHSTVNFSDAEKEAVVKSGPVRCAAVNREFRYILTAGEDKMLKLWEVKGLKLLSQRELPKKPTAVSFTADAQTLLVSDKFGDIFSYPFNHIPQTPHTKPGQSKDALSSHENPSGGTLILGHASPLNAFVLTQDERYIISADRDEHVRVSRFPKGYNIEMYCLGHLKFVSAIHIPLSSPSTLISGGGDPSLKVWDWMSGEVKYEVPIGAAVEPFIGVRALKRKRGAGDEDGDGGDEVPEGAKGKGKTKGKKKAKAKKQHEAEDDDGPTEEEEEEPQKLERVLVLKRIESVDLASGVFIVFSAVGATALFMFPFKPDVDAGDIRHVDFGQPVVDFFVLDNGSIFVNLDGGWSQPSDSLSPLSLAPAMVKILRVSSGELSEDSGTQKALIEALNSRALIPATLEGIKQLDLYGELTSMPKYSSDPDPGAFASTGSGFGITTSAQPVIPIGAPELSSSTRMAKGTRAKAEPNKKEIGRMKTKQAVLAKAMELELEGKKDVDESEIKTKKVRSDGAEGSREGQVDSEDVAMSET